MEVQWCLHQLQHKLQRLRLVQQYHEKRISHRLVCHTGNFPRTQKNKLAHLKMPRLIGVRSAVQGLSFTLNIKINIAIYFCFSSNGPLTLGGSASPVSNATSQSTPTTATTPTSSQTPQMQVRIAPLCAHLFIQIDKIVLLSTFLFANNFANSQVPINIYRNAFFTLSCNAMHTFSHTKNYITPKAICIFTRVKCTFFSSII